MEMMQPCLIGLHAISFGGAGAGDAGVRPNARAVHQAGRVRPCLCLVFPLHSWLRHRFCLVVQLPLRAKAVPLPCVSTGFVAKTLPLPCVDIPQQTCTSSPQTPQTYHLLKTPLSIYLSTPCFKRGACGPQAEPERRQRPDGDADAALWRADPPARRDGTRPAAGPGHGPVLRAGRPLAAPPAGRRQSRSRETPPLPCVRSAAVAAETAPALRVSTASVAKTLPLPCVCFHCRRG